MVYCMLVLKRLGAELDLVIHEGGDGEYAGVTSIMHHCGAPASTNKSPRRFNISGSSLKYRAMSLRILRHHLR